MDMIPMARSLSRHRRQYDRPPIKERVFEVHVAPGQVTLAQAKDALRERWAEFSEVEPFGEGSCEVVWNPGEMAVQTKQTYSPRLRFWRPGRQRLLQAAPSLFAANDLVPEPGWDEFAPMFRQAFMGYREVMQPRAMLKAVLRYINRVTVPREKSVRDFFSIFPRLPEERERAHAPFQMVVEMGAQRAGPSLIGLAFVGAENDQPVYALELIVESGSRPTGDPDLLFSWTEEAHDRMNELFDLSITDEARQHFGERRT